MPETTEKYHRVPTGTNCDVTATITISAERGIKALYCGGSKQIRTYLFDVNKWTMEEAKKWVREHKKQGKGVFMEKLYTKAFVKEIGDKEGVLQSAVITSEVFDREGEMLKADGGQFDNFLKNPVLLWAHNIREMRPPIGKILKVWREGNKWSFTPEFDLEDPFAADIYRKYKEGFLNAFSIGFMPIDKDNNTYNSWEALEFSGVPVGAHPEALVSLRAKGFETKTWEEVCSTGICERDEIAPQTKEVVDEYKELAGAFMKVAKENARLQMELKRRQKQTRDHPNWNEVQQLVKILNQATSKVLREIKTKGGEK